VYLKDPGVLEPYDHYLEEIIMAKFYSGNHVLDTQVTGFDMSAMTEGVLTLPTGAVKNIAEISDAVKVGVNNPALAGGSKLVQEKHLKDLEAALVGQINTVDAKVDAEVLRATAAEGVLQGNIDAEEISVSLMILFFKATLTLIFFLMTLL
jgi:hypothetical protein